MAPTSGSTTSPGSSPRPSRCSRRSAHARAASRSAPPSSTCATRTRCTWPRTPGAADIIAGGRLQLGISRGSPEQVIDGWRYFGYAPAGGRDGCRHGPTARRGLPGGAQGRRLRPAEPATDVPQPAGAAPARAAWSEGLRDRIWWGSATDATAVWAATLGMNLQSSTLKFDESGEPFHVQQRKQIEAYREAWKAAGHERSRASR